MEFVDTTPTQKGGVFIPSEALMINGRTIEEQISGYQTLTVTGRGPLPKKITAETPDGRDGQRFIEAYYTTRSIVVAYQIIADTAEDLIAKYIQLATILGNNEFTFNFKDDPDWYYTGTVSATSDLPVGVLAGNGSFTITCSDPHSYSTEKRATITNSGTVSDDCTNAKLLELDYTPSETASTITITNNGFKMSFSGATVNAGDTLSIDPIAQNVELNGVDKTAWLDFDSDFENFPALGDFAVSPDGILSITYKKERT
ncbi:distal tail protein Dit [Ligilactobacillus aviarius]|uniref:Phage tail protein n=1 Tax=Ligilactobacillus aviarius TaxID=1606 RepID=A0A510WST2_9LACO|nr:distal tail protein Dit [Ligilactobacillus aviarius]KRM39120.1 hypothetical protein FC33_GL001532 [Ligilactobacillus aviarius subsp. aviarius DSM 20655]GEK42284.1 hypothetical protein LAV01_11160 [Ligilactobacillus aviarius]